MQSVTGEYSIFNIFIGKGSPYTLSNHAVVFIAKIYIKQFHLHLYILSVSWTSSPSFLHSQSFLDKYITTKEGHILEIVCADSLGCQQT